MPISLPIGTTSDTTSHVTTRTPRTVLTSLSTWLIAGPASTGTSRTRPTTQPTRTTPGPTPTRMTYFLGKAGHTPPVTVVGFHWSGTFFATDSMDILVKVAVYPPRPPPPTTSPSLTGMPHTAPTTLLARTTLSPTSTGMNRTPLHQATNSHGAGYKHAMML